ncbi:DUF6153 family protein [Streptomyces sp. NPDC059002]|uniref:DUF6153 family protein n=1 Tax=Streptomyces sp. NPDC059002 TaxID=3346690 RepID=UPI003674D3E0
MGLGLVLFGLLYTHAASPDATVRHVQQVDAASAHASAAPRTAPTQGVASATHGHDGAEPSGERHGGHSDQHAFEECALGQPSHGPDVDAPCVSPLDSATVAPVPTYAEQVRPSAVRGFVVPTPHAAESPVLRI